MVAQRIIPNTDPLTKYLGLSISFHVAILLIFTIKSIVFPGEAIIIRDAIRVDIVGLPDKIEPPKPKVTTPSEPVKVKTPEPPKAALEKPVKKSDPKVDIKKAKTEQVKALERLKSLSAIDKIEKEIKEKATVRPEPEYKGNVINPGDSLQGLDAIDHNKYFSSLKGHLLRHFIIPQWLAEANLRTKAIVKIDERGYVISRELTEKSGNATFDSRVLEAIDNASPFPPPPSRLKNVVAVNGMIFGFPE